jgi:hypothetical protein
MSMQVKVKAKVEGATLDDLSLNVNLNLESGGCNGEGEI